MKTMTIKTKTMTLKDGATYTEMSAVCPICKTEGAILNSHTKWPYMFQCHTNPDHMMFGVVEALEFKPQGVTPLGINI